MKSISLRQFKDIVSSRTKGVMLFMLTPEIAEFLMGRNSKNRQVKKDRVEQYVRDIKSGWNYTFEGMTLKMF